MTEKHPLHIVIAGSYMQFVNWCRSTGKNLQTYTYVNDEHRLCGIRPEAIHLVGRYGDNAAYMSGAYRMLTEIVGTPVVQEEW